MSLSVAYVCATVGAPSDFHSADCSNSPAFIATFNRLPAARASHYYRKRWSHAKLIDYVARTGKPPDFARERDRQDRPVDR